MSDSIIVYGSKYGSTRRYAKELGKMTDWDVVDYCHVKHLNSYRKIVYLGALFAGGVLGLKKTLAKVTDFEGKRIAVITVGITDPRDKANVECIREGIREQVAEELFDRLSLFHLRGGIDRSKLNLKHPIMMYMVHRQIKKLPEQEMTPENRFFMATYNKKVDFVDFNSLVPVRDALQLW